MKNLLDATEAGLGNGETPIFPVQIFKVKEGVSYNAASSAMVRASVPSSSFTDATREAASF